MPRAYSGFSEMRDSLDLGIPLGLGNSGSHLRPRLSPDAKALAVADMSRGPPGDWRILDRTLGLGCRPILRFPGFWDIQMIPIFCHL